jgi:EmrB/QacA subfamily drug resistance transporter
MTAERQRQLATMSQTAGLRCWCRKRCDHRFLTLLISVHDRATSGRWAPRGHIRPAFVAEPSKIDPEASLLWPAEGIFMARSSEKTPVLGYEVRRVATVTVLGSIMSILDTTIVAVALATLGKDFHVSVSTIQWVSTGYLLALAVVIPITGWSIERFGAKRMWMLSMSLFIGGSTLCGLAWSANALILFRILQGLGGGMILPIGQSMLARSAGPQRMGRVMSVIGVPTVMGPVLGPVLGGLIVSNFSWRWIFYVNVPIGIVALILSARFLHDNEPKVKARFDALGFCLLSPGLAALVYALSEVGTTGSMTSTPVIVSFVLGVLLMVGFVLRGLRATKPLLALRLFANRNFTIANICIFVMGATLFGSMFLLPLYYQIARGQSPWVAGLLMAPQGIGAAFFMRLSGTITDRVGPRHVVPFGIVLMALATVPFAFVTTSTNELLLGATLFVRGIGLGLSMMPIMAAAYFDLDHADVPSASTTLNIVRQVGGSVATALFAVILDRQIVTRLGSPNGGTSSGFSLSEAVKLPPAVADKVAYAFAHTFWWAVGTILIAFVPTLLLPNKRAAPAPTPSAATNSSDDARAPVPVLAE